MKNSLIAFTIGASLSLCALPAAVAATWTGTNGAYAGEENWDTGMVPCNELTAGDNTALIDAAVTINQNATLCTVSNLTLGPDVVLRPLSGSSYTTASATIEGRIDGRGGILTATQAVLGERSSVSASDGSIITLGASSILSTEPADVSKNILVSSGAGSRIDLSSVSALDASYDSSDASGTYHRINVQDSGTIDLSGLVSITGPIDAEDRLLIDASGGGNINFDSLSNVTAGGFVHLAVSDDSTLTLPAASSFESTIFVAEAGGSILANTSSWSYGFTSPGDLIVNLMTATGTGVLDLSGASALNLHILESSGSPPAIHRITASGGGLIDLSGLETVAAITDDSFASVNFQADDGGTINLSRLASVDMVGDRASVNFQADGGGTIDLSRLSSVGPVAQINFNAHGGSNITLPSITSVTNANFVAGDNSSIIANPSLALLNQPKGITATDAALIDFSGAREINCDDQYGNSIIASENSEIDLSGLLRIVGDETPCIIRIQASEDAKIRLDGLTTIEARPRSSINAFNHSVVELPSLESVDGVFFSAGSEARVIANKTSWTLSYTTPLEYPTFNFLLRAYGTGAILDLAGLEQIDTSFPNSLGRPASLQIDSSEFGIIDLSSLLNIVGPVDEGDSLVVKVSNAEIFLDSLRTTEAGGRVVFVADQSAKIDLPSAESFQNTMVDAASNSEIAFGEDFRTYAFTLHSDTPIILARTGSRIDMSSVTTFDSAFTSDINLAENYIVVDHSEFDLRSLTEINFPAGELQLLRFDVFGTGSLLVLGPLESITGDGRARIEIDRNATLEFPSSFKPTAKTWLRAYSGSNIHIHGDYSFDHTSTTFFNIAESSVLITGDSSVDIEVGGDNVGATQPTHSNFGMGQLTIGTEERPVNARLVDAVDNGPGDVCAAAGIDREALYLFGLFYDASADGLRIANGSTLDLGGLDVYAEIGGVLMHLNPLVTPGVPYPFDEGFLALGTVFDIDRDGIQDSLDNCVLESNPKQIDSDGDGYGNRCDADLDGDLVVNEVDLGLFKLAFHAPVGSLNWNPSADFNGDQRVNVIDLGLLKQRFFEAPGPACPVPGP